jgi:hypothetical protein
VKRFVFSASSVLFISLLACNFIWAQATAQISGAVRDQSGAVLPGVEITATQTDTGISRTTVTNETGTYVLPNLALGPYRFEAALPGFRSYAQSGIVLQVNASPVINVVLEVGQVSEQVDVQANAALVETRSSTVGTLIENARILDLPLNGRQVTDLITLAGSAVQQSTGDIRFNAQQSPYLAVAGGSGFGVETTLDGANHVNFMSATAMSMPFPDAMQEFKVETGGVGAQHGSSTAVSAVTKSGTNQLHGDLFEFVRNDLFNAHNYFAIARPTLKRNQFGGTIGGPIVKNKLFFFGGVQDTILRQDPQNTQAFVPTAAMMTGDWTAFTSPACNAGRQIALRAPFVNNRIDPLLYSPPALFIVNWRQSGRPFPTTDNPCGQITYGSLSASSELITIGKVDYQMSAKHTLFARIMMNSHHDVNPNDFNTTLLQNTGWIISDAGSYTVGSTFLVSANTVQSFRLAVNRNGTYYHNTGETGTAKLFNWCDAGVQIYCPPEATRIYSMTVNGAFNITSSFLAPHRYVGTSEGINEDLSLVRGTHQFAFGVGATHGQDNSISTFVSPTQFNFTGGTTGLGLADFMTGRVGTMLQGRTSTHHVNAMTFGVYAADSWKATPKLTMNYGLRWEPYLPQYAEAIYNFSEDRFLKGIKSTVFTNAPAGLYYRGDPGLPKNGIDARWLQFAPRMGLAYDVKGDGKTSVRASYSLGYVYVSGDFRETFSGAPPYGNRVNLSNPVGGLVNPWLNVPGGNIFPYTVGPNAPFPANGQFETVNPNTHTPYAQSWNLAIQRQVGAGWLVSATYTGTNLTHVWTNRALNQAINLPGASCVLNGVTYTPCSSTSNTDARRRLTLEDPVN